MSFNSDVYTTESLSSNGVTITFRAYRNVPYCKNPKAPHLQVLNIFIPQTYIDGGEINGYTAKTAPIFFPNAIGGYSEAYPCDVQVREDGSFNTEAAALEHGYVVISAGARGRQTERDGKFIGKAPAFIVDIKAAVRYIRSIADMICGDVNKIISNGTSAGGATSALIGASGDAPEYLPYLEEIGAEMTSDKIFASSCYCPITNLENSDSAYEWQYGHLDERFWWDGHVKCSPEQMEYSARLKPLFPEYLNSIKPNGMDIDAFTEFLKSKILKSAKTADAVPEESGIDLENGTVDFPKYSAFITRMKPPGAFDNSEMNTIENELFGTETENKRHFTDFAFENDNVGGTLAEKETVYLTNALNFVTCGGCVEHWRIRHGASDRDTSFAISAILAQKLTEKGKNVDYFLPWGVPHSGDYDLPELFEWIDKICKQGGKQMKELETERLKLRHLCAEDTQAIFDNWASDPEVAKFLTWNAHESIETTEKVMGFWLEEYKNDNCYRYGIERKSDGVLMGMIDVVGFRNGNPVIGYCLGQKFWNNGYMTEVLRAVTAHLFSEGFETIEIEAVKENIGSNRVIEKAGFEFTGEHQEPLSKLKPQIVTIKSYKLGK